MSPAALPLLALLLSPPATAQAVNRCVDASGNPVFTDRRCVDVQATPVAPEAAVASGDDAKPPPPAASALCAASFGALRQTAIDAFASHDANRLAGLVLWEGYGSNGVVAGIRRLATLMRHPLLEVGGAPPPRDGNGAPDDDGTHAELVLRTAGDGGAPAEARFAVLRRAGCFWLRPE